MVNGIKKAVIITFLVMTMLVVGDKSVANAETITDRKWVENQMTSYYNDGKYTGVLERYLAGGTIIPEERKYVTGYPSSYYSDSYGFYGTLTRYISGYTTIPADSKYVSMTGTGRSDRVYVCKRISGGAAWDQVSQTQTDIGQTRYYNSGGYSGTLPRTSTDLVGTEGYAPPCRTESDVGARYTLTHHYMATFAGTVVRPEQKVANYLYQGEVKKPEQDTRYYRYRGWVEAMVTDPTETDKEPGSTNGSADGHTYWELRRINPEEKSKAYAESQYIITGKHYATRNQSHWMRFGENEKRQVSSITDLQEAEDVKGLIHSYTFGYEYTNYYTNNYQCIDSRGGGCYEWEFIGRTPAWERGENYELSGIMNIDHSQGEVHKADTMEEMLSNRFVVGRKDTWSPNKTSRVYHEGWKKNEDNDIKSKYSLKTQSSLPIKPGTWVYEIELPSDKHKDSNYNPLRNGGSKGSYYPVDVDKSLKEEYKR